MDSCGRPDSQVWSDSAWERPTWTKSLSICPGQSKSTCACCCMSRFPVSPPLYLSFNSSESMAVPELVLFGNHSQLGRVRPGCAVQTSRGLSVCVVKSLEYSLIWANWICVVVICHWLKGSLSAKCWWKKTSLACNVQIHYAFSGKALQTNLTKQNYSLPNNRGSVFLNCCTSFDIMPFWLIICYIYESRIDGYSTCTK